MKALLTVLIAALGAPALAATANPVTAAEQQVCRTLHQCLQIVKTHPHDAFDYAVLSEEFRRFGPKGRDALVRMIGKGGDSAGHAADLIAQMGDPLALQNLQTLKKGAPEGRSLLIARTIEAIEARQNGDAQDGGAPSQQRINQQSRICPHGTPLPIEARRREMPFFEFAVAAPDEFGAYRPSAAFKAPLRYVSRGWLRAAQPVPGGWLAAYPDGLIEFDNKTGTPRLRHRGEIVSLQSQQSAGLSPDHWVFIQNAKKQTYIAAVGPKMTRLKTALPAPLAELLRGEDGAIYASSGPGQSVTLLPDGSTRPGCAANAP